LTQQVMMIGNQPVSAQEMVSIFMRLVSEDEVIRLKFTNAVLAGRLEAAQTLIASQNGKEESDAEAHTSGEEEGKQVHRELSDS
jgi:predicted SpoU family rRNA methylase